MCCLKTLIKTLQGPNISSYFPNSGKKVKTISLSHIRGYHRDDAQDCCIPRSQRVVYVHEQL